MTGSFRAKKWRRALLLQASDLPVFSFYRDVCPGDLDESDRVEIPFSYKEKLDILRLSVCEKAR